MTRTQMCVVASLLLVAMTIAVLVSVLSDRKTALAAEGADLRTAESIWVSASLPELRLQASRFSAGTRVFKSMDDTTRAVALLTGEWDDVPLHRGSPLDGTAGEALAGSRRAPGHDVVEVDGKRYRVVGRLGVRADSLLADEAIVADPDLFTDHRERLRLDGPRIADQYRVAFAGRPFEVVDSGVNRRTNVDVVTPFLAAAGVVTALLVTVGAASYAVRREGRTARLRFLVGQRRRRLLLTAALRVALATVVPAVIAHELGRMIGNSLFVRPELVPQVAVISVAAMLVFLVGAWNGARRWS